MDNIKRLKDYLHCIGNGKDIYSSKEIDDKFKDIADILLNKCVIKVGEKRFRMTEIEFYLFSKEHKDIIAYPRTEMKGGEWFFHASGVDICFKSHCKKNGDAFLYDMENEFGGILIRSIMEVDKANIPINSKPIKGPLKSMDTLFKVFGAFADRDMAQIATIIEAEYLPYLIPKNSKRFIPLRNGEEAKLKSIFSETYKIKDDTYLKWKDTFISSLNYKWRYIISL